MPLLDHFRPPVGDDQRWNSFHSSWATRIADQIADQLPDEFRVEEHAKGSGGVEIDVAALRKDENPDDPDDPDDIRLRSAWQPPPPNGAMSGLFPDSFEVRVYQFSGGKLLVGAIELVSPGNKDRDATRQAFTAKVANYLNQGVSVIVVDVVTNRRANLHNELMRLLSAPAELELRSGALLYAAAYRPVLRDDEPAVDVWLAPLAVGDPLPTLPLRLVADYFVPVDFEAAYTEACRRRRLA